MAQPRINKRKTRRIVALVVTVLLVATVATAAAVFRALPGDSYAGLDETDRTAFDQLTEGYSAFATQPEAIWTAEYRYDREPLVLLRTDSQKNPLWRYAYLINMSGLVDTSGMKKVSFPDNPYLDDVYVSNTFGVTEPAVWRPANFVYLTVDKVDVLAFKFHQGMLGENPPEGLPFSTFLMHEAFHVNKQAQWTYDADSEARVFDFPHNSEHHELLKTEFSILDRLTISDAAAYPQLAADLAAIRAARYQKWPQLKAQDNAEAIEGPATYLERAFRQVVPEKSPPTGTGFVEWLEKAWDEPEEDSGLSYGVYYGTGAQLGVLLDTIAPTWKQDIEPSPIGKGWTPAESLRQATGVTTVPGDSVIAEISARYSATPARS